MDIDRLIKDCEDDMECLERQIRKKGLDDNLLFRLGEAKHMHQILLETKAQLIKDLEYNSKDGDN